MPFEVLPFTADGASTQTEEIGRRARQQAAGHGAPGRREWSWRGKMPRPRLQSSWYLPGGTRWPDAIPLRDDAAPDIDAQVAGAPISPELEFIRWLQHSLNRVLGSRFPVDGRMTRHLRARIRFFQRRAGLPATGYVDPATRRLLSQDDLGLPLLEMAEITDLLDGEKWKNKLFESKIHTIDTAIRSGIKSGLYAIWRASEPQGRGYIGMSRDLRRRLQQHKWCMTHLGLNPKDLEFRVRILPLGETDLRAAEKHFIAAGLTKGNTLLNANTELAPVGMDIATDKNVTGSQTAAKETTMTSRTCNCTQCRGAASEQLAHEFAHEFGGGAAHEELHEMHELDRAVHEAPADLHREMSEEEELELAHELLGVSSEEELDQFLGKMIRGVGRGLKSVGRFVGSNVVPVLAPVLKQIAKTALPIAGGALGSLIPVPGVGTLIGRQLGTMAANALEMETSSLPPEAADIEKAIRLVRIFATALRNCANADRGLPLETVTRSAVTAAIRRHTGRSPDAGDIRQSPPGGTWRRQGSNIVIYGI